MMANGRLQSGSRAYISIDLVGFDALFPAVCARHCRYGKARSLLGYNGKTEEEEKNSTRKELRR
jgi:hypothetical protein